LSEYRTRRERRVSQIFEIHRIKRIDSRLGVGLGSFLLRDDLTTDNELANIIGLVEVEEATDLGSPLGTESLGEDFVGKTGDVGLSLFDNDKVEGTNVGTDNATANGLAFTFTGSAGTVARVTLGEEELDPVGNQDTLLERETLLLLKGGKWVEGE